MQYSYTNFLGLGLLARRSFGCWNWGRREDKGNLVVGFEDLGPAHLQAARSLAVMRADPAIVLQNLTFRLPSHMTCWPWPGMTDTCSTSLPHLCMMTLLCASTMSSKATQNSFHPPLDKCSVKYTFNLLSAVTSEINWQKIASQRWQHLQSLIRHRVLKKLHYFTCARHLSLSPLNCTFCNICVLVVTD